MRKALLFAAVAICVAAITLPALAQVQYRGPDDRPIGPNGKVCELCQTPNELAARKARTEAYNTALSAQLKREQAEKLKDSAAARADYWYDSQHKACLEERFPADFCAAQDKRLRAQAAETKRVVDESMAKYERAQAALPAIGWYLRGCGSDVSYIFGKGGTPMDLGADLKRTGALAYDRTTYDADGHVASYTMVTVAGQVTQYFGTLAACRGAG